LIFLGRLIAGNSLASGLRLMISLMLTAAFWRNAKLTHSHREGSVGSRSDVRILRTIRKL
jgi:hypothetical protein